MSRRPRPPFLQAALAGVAAFALAAGGTATFQGYGRVPVRPVAPFLLVGAALHAASRYADPGTLPRGLAWAVWAAGAAVSGPLARPLVVGGLAAAGLLDLAFHAGEDPHREPASGRAAVGPALLAGSAGVVAALGAVRVAGEPGAAARLAATALLAGGLVAAYALRPGTRTPGRLLAGALAYGLAFRVLAAPVLPLGPILAYWVLVGAAALALLVGTRARVRDGLPPGLRRHRQRVETHPDPLDRGLEPALRAYVEGVATPSRVRRVVAEHDPDLARAVEAALPSGSAPRSRRLAAVADAFDVPEEDLT